MVAYRPRPTDMSSYVEVKKGDKFVTLVDIKTSGGVHFYAPATGGFKCVIPKGTILVAYSESTPESPGFMCVPEDEEGFAAVFVPTEDRKNPKYAGYSFIMECREIGKRLERVGYSPPDVAGAPGRLNFLGHKRVTRRPMFERRLAEERNQA